MKRIFFLTAIFSFLFSSCIFINDNSGQEPDNPPVDENTALVTFENKSKFDVNIYLGSNPYIGAVSCTVPASSTNYSKSFKISQDQSIGDVFYIEYLIKIGNAVFPYWTREETHGWKITVIKKDGNNKIIIDELTKCKSKSAYLLMENNTISDISVSNGNTPLKPYASNEILISKQGGCGIYEVSPLKFGECSDINLEHLELITIKADATNETNLPVSSKEVEAGYIYTISVNNDSNGKISASLKAVTPFNIDTQRKIWSLDNSIFASKYSTVMRPNFDKKSTLVMGTVAGENQKIGIARIDEYGNYSTTDDNFIAFNEYKNHLRTEIIDFVEQQDESIVMLCKQIFDDSKTGEGFYSGSENYVFACYDFVAKSLKWYKSIASNAELPDGSFYLFNFRPDTKNKLVQIGDNKFVCVGAYNRYYDYDHLHYMLLYIDGNDINENKVVNETGFKTIISSDYSDLDAGKERLASSAYFDGKDLNICGYDNWDAPAKNHDGYSDDIIHTGKIWKTDIESVKAGNFRFADENLIYSHDNCLFFSIEGSGEGNFVVCGEYKDTGKLLKGCYVTSSMIASESSCNPVLYTVPEKNHCWFNQLCQYGNKIVLCGTAASKRDGSENPLPFVVAFDKQGNKLWENLTYTLYTSALNILPNTIGTYTLQLGNYKNGNDKDNKIHYVNADLLGNEAR
jgi:hypothetical protein